jgi:GR25 family glycosyltransferase involved in LPS biosynthesis
MPLTVDELPAVCISLDRRADRWAVFQEYARAADLQVQRLSAVDAKALDPVNHPAVSLGTAHNIRFKTRRSHHEIDAAGAVGCSLSHFRAWEQLLAGGAPALLVFEDDAPIPADFKPRLARVLRELPADWDMVQFQMTVWDDAKGCAPIEGQSPWHLCTALMGSYAYMISRKGAQKMLDRAYPIEMHVDAYMAYMSKMGHIRMLWHPLIDIPGPELDSDITHGTQGILFVPTNMAKAGVVALDERSVWGLVTMAAVAGGLLALAAFSR